MWQEGSITHDGEGRLESWIKGQSNQGGAAFQGLLENGQGSAIMGAEGAVFLLGQCLMERDWVGQRPSAHR